jgi:hypothetical protein
LHPKLPSRRKRAALEHRGLGSSASGMVLRAERVYSTRCAVRAPRDSRPHMEKPERATEKGEGDGDWRRKLE